MIVEKATQCNEHLEIFYAIDNAYMVPLMAALSALRHETEKKCIQPIVTVLANELSTENQDMLATFGPSLFGAGHFSVLDITKNLPRYLPVHSPHNTYITRTAYARFLIPSLTQPGCKRALYMDADTLVKGDLAELLHFEFGGCPVAAVKDHIITSVSHPQGLPNWLDLGLSPDAAYFNSGVLLFSISDWNASECTRRLFDYCFERGDLLQLFDQEALNAALSGEIAPLEKNYNVFTNHLCNETVPGEAPLQRDPLDPADLEEARIIHYVGHLKPWKPGDTDSAERDLFFAALARTPLRTQPESMQTAGGV